RRTRTGQQRDEKTRVSTVRKDTHRKQSRRTTRNETAQGAKISSTKTANRSKCTQPCRIFVFLLVNVTTLTASVNSSSGRLPPCTPSVTGRFVSKLIANTAGIVSPMVASTEPSRIFIERCK